MIEPLWREDLEDQADYVRDTVKVLHNMITRAETYHASPALVDHLRSLRDRSAEILDEIEMLKHYLPGDPGR